VNNVCIREFDVLFPDSAGITESLGNRVISKSAWEWLLKEAAGTEQYKPLVRPIKRSGKTGLQVLNYVGVITTPCGWQIEIVPKIDKYSVKSDGQVEQEREAEQSRTKLIQMLTTVGIIKFRHFNHASLKVFNKPLPEVLIQQFLNDVRQLIKRGIRNDYVAVREEASYLKGRLNIAAQIRQPIDRRHLFQIEYDEFLPDRAENRLIHSALIKVTKISKNSINRRLASELLFVFNDIPLSLNYSVDFSHWLGNDRSIVHYQAVKPWCELILNGQSPFSLAGPQKGLSFLFPMNVLFEKYVAVVLSKQLESGFILKEQAASEYLITEHIGKKMFKLKPDLLISSAKEPKEHYAILDCKWKLIKPNKRDKNYGISSGDMYQLYAYGQKYLGGKGDMFLIYPETDEFKEPLSIFKFDAGLILWAIPFRWGDSKNSDFVYFDDKWGISYWKSYKNKLNDCVSL